jgi:hypothetical protein
MYLRLLQKAPKTSLLPTLLLLLSSTPRLAGGSTDAAAEHLPNGAFRPID